MGCVTKDPESRTWGERIPTSMAETKSSTKEALCVLKAHKGKKRDFFSLLKIISSNTFLDLAWGKETSKLPIQIPPWPLTFSRAT